MIFMRVLSLKEMLLIITTSTSGVHLRVVLIVVLCVWLDGRTFGFLGVMVYSVKHDSTTTQQQCL